MKIKGKDIDYILLIVCGICLAGCIYECFIVSEASLAVRAVILFTSFVYVISFKKRIRQIQSSEQKVINDE